MQNLEGKTAFVTGGASGIGLGIAKALLGAGMNVAIADIRDDHLAAATAELDGGARVLAAKLDVTNRDQFAAVADAVEAAFGKIHLLVNNAGVAVVGPSELATFADWDWVMGVNLGGTINGIVTMLPRILSHGEGGHIVCTASMSARVPVGGTAIYSSTKAAVTSIMECMRPELEGRGVICSAFCPGAVQSNIAQAGETRPVELADSGYAAYITANAGIVGMTRSLAREFGPQHVRVNAVAPGWVLTERQKEHWVTPEALATHLAQEDCHIPMEPAEVSIL